jgi:hypothetical protein
MPGHEFAVVLVTQGNGLALKADAAGAGLCGGSH